MTTSPTARLEALGLVLPPVVTPLAAYVPAVRIGDQVWTSGQLPLVAGALTHSGKVGAGVTPEQAIFYPNLINSLRGFFDAKKESISASLTINGL